MKPCMPIRTAVLACLIAGLAACSPNDSSGPSNAAGAASGADHARAQWPLPPEPEAQAGPPLNKAAPQETGAEPAAMGNSAATGNQAAAAEPPAPRPEPLPTNDLATFRAHGTEPFWSVTVVGGTLVLDMPGKPSRYFSVATATDGGIRRYSGEGIRVTAKPVTCNDGMSDRVYGQRVQVTVPDGTFKGCGSARASGR